MTEVCACVDVLECMCHLGKYDGVPITVYRHLLSMYESSRTALFKDGGGNADRRGGRGEKKKVEEGGKIQVPYNNIPLQCV